MAKKKSKLWVNGMNFVYGIAAAIVIVGALFKILHWEFANEMLIVGMLTEAFVFAVSAFDPPSPGYDWERVYPALADPSASPEAIEEEKPLDLSWQDSMRQLDGEVFGDLSNTLANLNTNVSKLSNVTDAAGATSEYTDKLREATGKIDTLNRSYSVAAEGMGAFADAATDAQAYHAQVQEITKNLGTLNSIYELELQDAKTHLKSLNQFYGAMSQAMQSMSEASRDAEQYKKGMEQLTRNIDRLNTVYGNMLSAMSGGTR